MGTTIALFVPAARITEAETLTKALFETWEETLSRFHPTSELSQVNQQAGQPTRVSALLWEVLTTALTAAQATDGLYDPTLGQQMLRIGYDRSFDAITEGSAAMPAPGPLLGGAWQRIVLDPSSRTLRLPKGVALDFGGIAKGMAVAATLALLTQRGITPALVNGGGDLAAQGVPDEGAWTVAVPGCDHPGAISLTAGALATSSVGQRAWQQGTIPRHHLLDPRTGEPVANGVWAVTVAAARCEQAEVAAKVALILGEQAGLAFLQRWGLVGQILLADGRLRATTGWPLAEVTL
jgi:thiamine biosynthesis lipoprotein